MTLFLVMGRENENCICVFRFSWSCSLVDEKSVSAYHYFYPDEDYIFDELSFIATDCNGLGTRKINFIPQGDLSGTSNTDIIQDRTHIIEINGMLIFLYSIKTVVFGFCLYQQFYLDETMVQLFRIMNYDNIITLGIGKKKDFNVYM